MTPPRPRRHVSQPFRTTRRVEFGDTDMAGIVHFANFFRYMESAETEFLRSARACRYRGAAGDSDRLPARVRRLRLQAAGAVRGRARHRRHGRGGRAEVGAATGSNSPAAARKSPSGGSRPSTAGTRPTAAWSRSRFPPTSAQADGGQLSVGNERRDEPARRRRRRRHGSGGFRGAGPVAASITNSSPFGTTRIFTTRVPFSTAYATECSPELARVPSGRSVVATGRRFEHRPVLPDQRRNAPKVTGGPPGATPISVGAGSQCAR